MCRRDLALNERKLGKLNKAPSRRGGGVKRKGCLNMLYGIAYLACIYHTARYMATLFQK